MTPREFGETYSGEHLRHVAFPLGGLGAGMLCLEGNGALAQASLRHRPDLLNDPRCFAAVCVRSAGHSLARVLEGPVPSHKPLQYRSRRDGSGSGAAGRTYGLPRLREATFKARFPSALVRLTDPDLPLELEITGWSPFIPGNADDSSLPIAVLEYHFRNSSTERVEAVFSFHAMNPVVGRHGDSHGVRNRSHGFVAWQTPEEGHPEARGAFAVSLDSAETRVDTRWFRGGWFDPLTLVWKQVSEFASPSADAYEDGAGSPGGSVYASFELEPGAQCTHAVQLAWHIPDSALSFGPDATENYSPWYAGRYPDIDGMLEAVEPRLSSLRAETFSFSDALHDTTLPTEAMEAVTANLSILRSPTVMRQADGRLWAWEGCNDRDGCCAGSCTHVWNYAQAIAHLFPDLERTLRATELQECQDRQGHCQYRAPLPIREAPHDFHAAADGQLGGVLKVYRDWRISGDDEWLHATWPRLQTSLDYAIQCWDPDGNGVLREPHHNTYDIEFWGADGMCSSIYVAALEAAARICAGLRADGTRYADLAERGRKVLEEQLFDGEYFVQQVEWESLRAPSPAGVEQWNVSYSPEAVDLLEREGPKYQYGSGCLSDGVIGEWFARVCGLGPVLEPEKVKSHLRAVHRYNLKHDLSTHANPQRSAYAFGSEGGLLLCSWPKGGKPTLPFVYSDEVWTGIEYQVASHLILEGLVEEGLEIVRTARRRYDGRIRNPFDEIECGHYYARALSSFALLQALSGARYDAVDRVLRLEPPSAGDFRAFLATAGGFGTVGVHEGEPFLEVCAGQIPVERIDYRPLAGSETSLR